MIKYDNETYLNTAEAANYLGKTITAFRQFMYRNKLPRRKVGGRIYFPVNKLNGYFARMRKIEHFEGSGLKRGDVYDMAQLSEIFLTTKQNIYTIMNRHKIKRYKDNTGKTLYDRVAIDGFLDRLKSKSKEVDDI